ncbi:12075_t:CDS:1, partial [Gigaspora margarita]
VTAISIKLIDFDFETMPSLGINSVIIGTTTQTAKLVKDDLALDFYMEERIREKEPQVFGFRQDIMLIIDTSSPKQIQSTKSSDQPLHFKLVQLPTNMITKLPLENTL